jgi:glycosyltransferase involved in cell wall biosynthesis
MWDYYCNLKNKYDVQFISENNIETIIEPCNCENPDVVHIMYDDFVIIADKIKCKRIFLTTHFAYITSPTFKEQRYGYFYNVFSQAIQLQKYFTLLALSQAVADVYIKHGFDKSRVKVLRNGARADSFAYTSTPKLHDKSVYVAKIEQRKCQFKYQSIPNIDFVGNFYSSSFDCNNTNYLGEWTKEMLYNNLTNYGNLVLLSDGEADSLVIKEALVAGLGLVISECAKANLDLSKPFIDIIPNDKLHDLGYITTVIEINREICKGERENIRKYGVERFSWNNIIDEYVKFL